MRLLAILPALVLVFGGPSPTSGEPSALSAGCVSPEFAFSLSASPETPWVNHLPSVPDTFSVYLWLTCKQGEPSDGMELMQGLIETDYEVQSFQGADGVTALWGPSEGIVLAQYGLCADPPFMLGRLEMTNPQGLESGSVCFDGEEWGASPGPALFAHDCCAWWQFPDTDTAGVTGFAVGGEEPCFDDRGCELPISVETMTWGRIKGRYR